MYDHDSHSIFADDRCKDITTEYKNLQTGKPMISGKNWEIVKSAPIKICSYAWIGMNCIILKGVTIGEGAIVGAGSIVTHDVAPWTLVAGNPAKFIKNLAPHNTY